MKLWKGLHNSDFCSSEDLFVNRCQFSFMMRTPRHGYLCQFSTTVARTCPWTEFSHRQTKLWHGSTDQDMFVFGFHNATDHHTLPSARRTTFATFATMEGKRVPLPYSVLYMYKFYNLYIPFLSSEYLWNLWIQPLWSMAWCAMAGCENTGWKQKTALACFDSHWRKSYNCFEKQPLHSIWWDSCWA